MKFIPGHVAARGCDAAQGWHERMKEMENSLWEDGEG